MLWGDGVPTLKYCSSFFFAPSCLSKSWVRLALKMLLEQPVGVCEARQQGGQEAGSEGAVSTQAFVCQDLASHAQLLPLPRTSLVFTVGKGAGCPMKGITKHSTCLGEQCPTPCEKQLNSPPHAEGRAWLWACSLLFPGGEGGQERQGGHSESR